MRINIKTFAVIVTIIIIYCVTIVLTLKGKYEKIVEQREVALNTIILSQKDSFDYVIAVTKQTLQNKINQDSILIADLKKKGIKPKQVTEVIDISITSNPEVETVPIKVSENKTKNGTYPWTYSKDCVTINGSIVVNDSIVTNNVSKVSVNSDIVVYKHNEIIKWWQYKKKKKEGYKNTLRNMFSSKLKENISGTSKCFNIRVKDLKNE